MMKMRMRVVPHHVRVVDRDDVRCAALLNCRYVRVLVSFVDEKAKSGQSSATVAPQGYAPMQPFAPCASRVRFGCVCA